MGHEFAEMLDGCTVKGEKSGKVFDLVDMLRDARAAGRFVIVAPDGTTMMVGLLKGAEFFVNRLVKDGTASLMEKAQADEQLAKDVRERGAESVVKAVLSLVLFGEDAGQEADEQQEEGEGE